MCVCHRCSGVCEGQVSQNWSPRHCEPRGISAGNWTQALLEQRQAFLTTELSSPPHIALFLIPPFSRCSPLSSQIAPSLLSSVCVCVHVHVLIGLIKVAHKFIGTSSVTTTLTKASPSFHSGHCRFRERPLSHSVVITFLFGFFFWGGLLGRSYCTIGLKIVL